LAILARVRNCPGVTPIVHSSVENRRTLELKTRDAADKVIAFYRGAQGGRLEAGHGVADRGNDVALLQQG
jgi:hypothetical protein